MRDPNRPRAFEVRSLVRLYYAKPGNEVGGSCHVVLDDKNVSDGDIGFCLHHCGMVGDEEGAEIMRKMLRMSMTQRRKVVAR